MARRLSMIFGALLVLICVGAWVYSVAVRPSAPAPDRVGPWHLGAGFDPPSVPPERQASGVVSPKRTPVVKAKMSASGQADGGRSATIPVDVDLSALGLDAPRSAAPGRAAVVKTVTVPIVVPEPESSRSAHLSAVRQRRSDTYVPGDLHGWIGYDIIFDKPMLVRAGGELRAGSDAAGPSGLASSEFEKNLARRQPEFQFRGTERVIGAAPYLALIGRICSREVCSAPFVVGAGAVLCPSPLAVKGELQLWTNNYVRVEGFQTVMPYSRVSGGYRFKTEPAPAGVCDDEPSMDAAGVTESRRDAAVIAAGRVLQDAAFSVSSRQTSWKPFFLPLDQPLVIRASGQMHPREASPSTDPNGIVVPAGRRWSYPGTSAVVVDETHRLFDERLPYQALIGRLCNATSCSDAFLVGSERTLCPTPLDERLELWVNHIVRPTGTRQFALDVLAFQSRRGEYRFEVSKASAGACGK